jgi:hypothetical protein
MNKNDLIGGHIETQDGCHYQISQSAIIINNISN